MTIIDISHTLEPTTPPYPGDVGTSVAALASIEENGYRTTFLGTCLHTGTHIDLPAHMLRGGGTVISYAPDCFIGPGVLLDVRGKQVAAMEPRYERLTLEGRVVLLYTGFGARYYEPGYFTEYPAVDEELAAFFVERKIKMLGIDAPAPDYHPFPVHRLLMSHHIPLLENVTNLHALPYDVPFEVAALPLKIDAEASPVRAVCRLL